MVRTIVTFVAPGFTISNERRGRVAQMVIELSQDKIDSAVAAVVSGRSDMLAAMLNATAARIHEGNAKWWVSLETGERIERNVGEMLMLCVSELAEAMEGARKGRADDHLPHRPMIEVELADCLIRIFDMAAGLRLDLGGAVVEKLAYNAQRADHSLEARRAAGGKKF